jgi:hypothetical protein
MCVNDLMKSSKPGVLKTNSKLFEDQLPISVGAIHFFVMSLEAKYKSFRAAWGVGNEDLFLITFFICR